MNGLTVTKIKLKQNVLIVKAALSVLQTKEKSTGMIEESLYREFEAAVEAVKLPNSFALFDR